MDRGLSTHSGRSLRGRSTVSNRHRPGERSSTITRRKFTLTERLDTELQQLARRHYQDNVSLCLRAAVEDHKSALNGEGRIALKRVEQKTAQLHELIVEINNNLSAVASDIDEGKKLRSRDAPLSVADDGFSDAQRVLDELHGATIPLRAEDLTERLELSSRRVICGLEQLIDVGSIIESPHGPRYQPITMQPTPTTDQNNE